jgi:propionyl-CoA carboxylase beta chain
MTDFIFMVKDSSYMFVTGPEVVKTVTHEEITAEELGGAITHTTRSGVADLAFDSDVEALLMIRRFYNYLPLNNRQKAPGRQTTDTANRIDMSLDTLVPDNPNKPYDIKELILKVVDDIEFFESNPTTPRTSSSASRMEGQSVGIVANQPLVGRLPRHQEDQGRPLCASATIPSDPHLRRRPWLHAGHRLEQAASSSTARSCCSLSPRRPCQK